MSVKTNRKRTPGRHIYHQEVNKVIGTKEVSRSIKDKNGNKKRILKTVNVVEPIGKNIKHIQETSTGIKRKILFLNLLDKIASNKAKNDNSKKKK